MSDLKWFLIGFLVLYLIWYVSGGPEKNRINRTNPFLDEPYKGGEKYDINGLKIRQN